MPSLFAIAAIAVDILIAMQASHLRSDLRGHGMTFTDSLSRAKAQWEQYQHRSTV